MLEFDDERIKSLLVDVEEQARLKSAGDIAARLRDLLQWHQRKHGETTVQAQVRALADQKLGEDEGLRVLEQLIEQERSLRGISAPMERQGLAGE
jgi:hypothetical protein